MEFPEQLKPFEAELAGRSMIVQRALPLPVECVVRGFLAGSAWKEYRATGQVGGHRLPSGLQLADPLPEPIFTPSTKADSGHDESIDWDGFVARLGDETVAIAFARGEPAHLCARRTARGGARHPHRGHQVRVRTWDEQDGEIMLIDECLTPDSSRFWPAAEYQPGSSPPSFDKTVRARLPGNAGLGQKRHPRRALPPEVISRTSAKYLQALEVITR